MKHVIYLLGLLLLSFGVGAADSAGAGSAPEDRAVIFEPGSEDVVLFNARSETVPANAAKSRLFFQTRLSGEALMTGPLHGQGFQVEGGAPSLEDIAFLSGHYFDPDNSGDGFDFFVVDRGNNPPGIVIWFYGYDLSGNRLWLISDLIIPSDSSGFTNAPMFRSTGSGFSGAGNFQQVEWGRLDFQSTGCGTAIFTLTPNGQSSRVTNAVQLIDIPGPGCFRESPRAFQTIAGISGNWYRPNEPGDGINIHTANSGLVVFFYGYDNQGDPLWLLNTIPYFGPILPGMELNFDMKTGSGGNFYNVAGAITSNWGTMRLLIKTCTTAEVSLTGIDGTKQVSVVQLAQAAQAICESPGTVQLSQPMVTFDSLGETRVVSAQVFDSGGAASPSSALSVEVLDEDIASINSNNNGVVELEAATNFIASTKATFFDPITNSVEEAEIQVVDFQPNAYVIPVEDVISGTTPLKGQINEAVLTRNALTESLAADDYIWVEDGLYGQVDALALETNTVRIQLLGVSIVEVQLNLVLSGSGTTSSAQLAGNSKAAGMNSSTLQQSGLQVKPGQTEGVSASCSINDDPISIGNHSWDVSLDQPGGSISRFYEVVNGVPSPNSRIEGRLRLTGEFNLDLPSNAPIGSTVFCEILNLTVHTPATPLWGQYSGGLILPVDISAEFTLENAPPDSLARFQWGLEPTFSYQLATQELQMGLDTGLTGSRVINFGPTAFANVPAASVVNVTPSLSGQIALYGVGPRTSYEQMDLIQADIGFPLDVEFNGPADIADPAYRGPGHLLSLQVYAEQNVDNASTLLDPLGFEPPNLPTEPLIGPVELALRGSPEIDMVELDCGSRCGVGDPRQFEITLSRPGLVNLAMTGELAVYRLQQFANEGGSNYIATELGSTVFTGQTPVSLTFQLAPDSGGSWEIAPRFTSWDHGGVYGGPSVAFRVDDDACALNVTVNGSGIVQSDPGGISCPEDCSEVYDSGTQVFLNATPASGWSFESWGGQCDATDGPSCFVVMECGRSVEANFSQLPVE